LETSVYLHGHILILWRTTQGTLKPFRFAVSGMIEVIGLPDNSSFA
jgi:hypothetical protein